MEKDKIIKEMKKNFITWEDIFEAQTFNGQIFDDEIKFLIHKIENNYMIKEMWNEDEIKLIPTLTRPQLIEISQEIDDYNNDK